MTPQQALMLHAIDASIVAIDASMTAIAVAAACETLPQRGMASGHCGGRDSARSSGSGGGGCAELLVPDLPR